MDIYRVCRTCLNESHTNLVSIHSAVNSHTDENAVKIEKDENYTNIAHILDDLTENKYVCISFFLFSDKMICNLSYWHGIDFFCFRFLQNSEVYPYPNKICRLCLNNLQNAYEFKRRCVSSFERLMKLSDFNTVYPEEFVEVKPFMQVDVDVLIDENVLSEDDDTNFDGGDGAHFNEDASNESTEPLVSNSIIFSYGISIPSIRLIVVFFPGFSV